MAPLTKETLEVSNPTSEAAVSRAASEPKQSSGHLRSDAVSLEIAVKVHGSRVTEVVREVTPHTEPFEEQTNTMIVFPQGAVVRMSTAVTMGQMLVLTNLKSRQDAICRVVKVRTFSKMQGYVEIEFTHAQPGYWGVHFPSDAPPAVAKTPAPPPAEIPPAEPKSDSIPDVSWAPARVTVMPVAEPASSGVLAVENPKTIPAPPAAPARPAKPESAFISIGSQEEVQPAASSMTKGGKAPGVETEREAHVVELPKKSTVIDFPPLPPAAPVPSLTMSELLGDEVANPPDSSVISAALEAGKDEFASPKAESDGKRLGSSFGSLTGGATLTGGHSASSELFGARLDLGLEATPEAGAKKNNWFLIAACIALVFSGAAFGVSYLRHQIGGHPSSGSALKGAPQTSAPQTSAPQTNVPIANPSNAEASHTVPPVTVQKPAPLPVTADGTSVTVNSSSAKPSTSSTIPSNAPPVLASVEPSAPAAPAKQSTPSVTSDMVASTLNAHPVSAQRADASQSEPAPTVDAQSDAADPNAAPPSISTTADIPALPAPEATPDGPVRVGGQIKEPTLRSYKQPIYPRVAKENHTVGDVVIDTQIDKAGNVMHMKVVSGPTILRDAALDALRMWKYEPSMLDGQPVAIEMMVTIKFRQ